MSGEILPFYSVCPATAEPEMRWIFIKNHPKLPDGDYGLLDAYCADPKCDCRVIYLWVIAENVPNRILDSINYGWEPLRFYTRWMGLAKPDQMVRDLKGPALTPMMVQSAFAPALFEIVAPLFKENDYLELLKKHYYQFKTALKNNKKK